MRYPAAASIVVVLGLLGCSPGPNPPAADRPYTGRLQVDAGTVYVLEESETRVGGACAGWNTVSLQRPDRPDTGMRDMMCWRQVGDMIETTTADGQASKPAPRSVFSD